MQNDKFFKPYERETSLIVSKDNEGLRINGNIVQFHNKNGIVMIENNTVGCGHSCHPNIDSSGSVKEMKAQGYWSKTDKTVKAHGFIYNVSNLVISDPLDLLAYHMQKGYRISERVLSECGNPLWAGISIILPKVD